MAFTGQKRCCERREELVSGLSITREVIYHRTLWGVDSSSGTLRRE